MTTYQEFVREAARNPDVLTKFMDDPDGVSDDMGLDAEASSRLRALAPSVERILLNTSFGIDRVAQTLGRLANTSANDPFTDSFTDQYQNQYSNSNPEQLEVMYGLEPRRSILRGGIRRGGGPSGPVNR